MNISVRNLKNYCRYTLYCVLLIHLFRKSIIRFDLELCLPQTASPIGKLVENDLGIKTCVIKVQNCDIHNRPRYFSEKSGLRDAYECYASRRSEKELRLFLSSHQTHDQGPDSAITMVPQ